MTAAGRTSARRGAPGGPSVAAPTPATATTRTPSSGELAWLLALPCAAVTLALILALGPLVGDLLLPRSSVTFFTAPQFELAPEPHEQGRFLVALLGPLLLAGATVALARRDTRLPARAVQPLVWTAQAALIGFAVVCVAIQRGIVFTPSIEPIRQPYFSNATLAASVLGAAAIALAVRSERVRAAAGRWTRETPARRLGWTLAAVLLVVVWQLHAFNTEGTVFSEHGAAAYHLYFTLDETFAVLNGRTPLVDFTAQYGALWPYPVAFAMRLLGTTVGVFSAIMCLLSAVAMLAIFDVLRRVTRSSLTALLLFAPFLATSWFLLRGPLENRYTLATIFADYPIRFAGPWLLAWLTARHLGRASASRAWPLFLVAGLVALNNVDHGLPALGALVAALLWTTPLTRRRLSLLAREAALGLVAAYALVALLTLLRAGALPDLSLLLRFAELYAGAGYAMLPMPRIGMHLLVYVTFVAALAVATVRAMRGPHGSDADRTLTGLLAFVAVFGLGSGAYYAGRSHPEVLVTSFGSWSLALALLTWLAVRQLAAQPRRWPEPATALCLVAFCVAACSLAQTPTPWSQVDRLRQTSAPTMRAPAGQPLVAKHVRRGEHVAVLQLLGHRIAENLHVTDVSPYTTALAVPTVPQLRDVVRALRREGGTKVFLPTTPPAVPDVRPALAAEGFGRVDADADGNELWVDGAPPAAEGAGGEIGSAP
jgi:hypothetical protein